MHMYFHIVGSIPSGYSTGSEITYEKVSACVVLLGLPDLPPEWLDHFAFPPAVNEHASSHILAIRMCCHIFNLANLIGENGIHVLICISLITNEFEHFTCLRAILFFFQVSSDYLFLIARFLVLCLSFFKNSSHFRNISPLCHVQNSLLVCSCFFLFVYDNFFLTRKFLFNIYVVIFSSLLLALDFEL